MAAAGFHSSGLAVSLVLPSWCRGVAMDAMVVSAGLALIGNHLGARPKPDGASEKSCVSTTCNYGFCTDELPASSWDGACRVAAICQCSVLGSTSWYAGTEAEPLLKETQKSAQHTRLLAHCCPASGGSWRCGPHEPHCSALLCPPLFSPTTDWWLYSSTPCWTACILSACPHVPPANLSKAQSGCC